MSDWMTRIAERYKGFQKDLDDLRKKKAKKQVRETEKKESQLLKILFPDGEPFVNPFRQATDTMTAPYNPLLAPRVEKENAPRIGKVNRQEAIKAGQDFYMNPVTGKSTSVTIPPVPYTREEAQQVDIRDEALREEASTQGKSEYYNPETKTTRATGAFLFPSLTGDEPEWATTPREMMGYANTPYEELDPFGGGLNDAPDTRARGMASPDPLVRWASDPKYGVFGLSPGDIAGIGLIVQSGAQGAKTLYDQFLAFRRLPQYQAIEQFARQKAAAGEPVNPQAKQSAQNAIRSAFNLYKRGMTEAADEIMAEFQRSYEAAFPKAAAPAETRLALGTRPIPTATQTGAMAMGGKQAPISGEQIAASLGVKYDGMMGNAHQFTIPEWKVGKGITFYVKDLANFEKDLIAKYNAFIANPPTGQTAEGLKAELNQYLEKLRAGFAKAETPTAGAKEPWMMTREEYRADVRAQAEGMMSPRATKTGFGKAQSLRKSDIERMSTTGADEAHRHFTRIALSEGKPVPPEVLKDYPDLQASIQPQRLPTEVSMPPSTSVQTGLPAQEIRQVNATARATGAVGAKAITPKYVGETAKTGETILDYGAGKNPIHTTELRKQGLDVTAYDIGANVVGGIHDVNALSRTYDTVFASNVLNVAPSEAFLRQTLKEIVNATKGRAVFNYPVSPRKLNLSVSEMESIVKEYFPDVKKVGGTNQSPLWEAKPAVPKSEVSPSGGEGGGSPPTLTPEVAGGQPPVPPPVEPPVATMPEPNKPTPIQNVRAFYKAKIADIEGATKDKIASLKDWANYNVEERNRVKNILTDYIQEHLPLRERGKLVDAVKNVKDQKGLDEIITRVDRMAEESSTRNLRTEILKELKEATPRNVRGVLKGKYTAGVQKFLDEIRLNINADRAKAQEKIVENITKFNEGKMLEEEMVVQNEILSMQGIKEQTSDELQNTLANILSLKKGGQTARQAKMAAIRAERESRNRLIVEEITGGKSVITAGATPEDIKETGFIENIFNSNYSFGSLLEKISKLSGKAPRKSHLADLDRLAFRANEAENAGTKAVFDQWQTKAKEIFETEDRGELSRIFGYMASEKVDLGTYRFVDETGPHLRKQVFTKAQLMNYYLQMQDEKNDRTFQEGMHWPYELRLAVINSLTDQEKAWADWMGTFLRTDYYKALNPIYSEFYGITLPYNPNYWPLRRDFSPDVPEEILVYEESAQYASVVPGAVKARTKNILPLKAMDVNAVFVNHITQIEHFKAWIKPMSEMRSVFNDPAVKLAIRQNHGEDILHRFQVLLDRFALNGVRKAELIHFLDVVRGNISRSVLGLKPSIAVQQPSSLLAFLTEMDAKELAAGVSDFLKNPVGNARWMKEHSPYIRARYEQGFERDIALTRQRSAIQRAATGRGSVLDLSYALIELGDKIAVLPGWWAKYKASLKKGLSQTDAMEEAGMAADRTQNTSAIYTLSTLQSSGSLGRLFTMFQTQQNRYFQIISNNMRDLRYHRGDPKKALLAVILVWAVLPMLFQFIADGLQFKPKRQIRAAVLGPINDLLVIGQISQFLTDKLMGEPFDYQPSPAMSLVNDTGDLFYKVGRLWEKWLNPEKEVTTEDLIKLAENALRTTGEVIGLPTPYGVQVEKALRGDVNKTGERERDWRELIFSRYALEEEKAQSQVSSTTPLTPSSSKYKPLMPSKNKYKPLVPSRGSR